MKRLSIAESESDDQTARDLDPISQYVSRRIRHRRMMIGITQNELADLIGVTYQQAHKYEKGINRISSGRLYQIAKALGVGIDYFFDGYDQEASKLSATPPTPQQRMMLSLAHHFSSIDNQKHREVICHLARVLCRES